MDPNDFFDDAHNRPRYDSYDDYIAHRHSRRRLNKYELLGQLAAVVVVIALLGLGIRHLSAGYADDQALKDAVYAEASQVWATAETTNLASMSAASSTTPSGGGSTIFGSGAFVVRTSEDQTLRYIEKRTDGGYVMGSVSAENAVIYEIEDQSKPRIETQTCSLESQNPEHEAWLDANGHDCVDTKDSWLPKIDQTRTRVYVPEGTVVDTFSVDAKG